MKATIVTTEINLLIMKAQMLRLKSLCLTILLILPFALTAQDMKTVIGTVTDELGEPLPGANIAVYDKDKLVRGTSTNINGDFRVDVSLANGDRRLEISYLGSKTQKIELTKENIGSPFIVRLQADEALLRKLVGGN